MKLQYMCIANARMVVYEVSMVSRAIWFSSVSYISTLAAKFDRRCERQLNSCNIIIVPKGHGLVSTYTEYQ